MPGWFDMVVYVPLGAVAGVLAGLLGVGGGLIIVPVLIALFPHLGFAADITPHLAVGTSLATIVLTSISSVRAHHKRGAVRWDIFSQLTPGIVVGAWLGAILAGALSGPWLQRVFALFAISVGVRMFLAVRTEPRYVLPGAGGLAVAGGVIGAISAIVGIGGGSMTVPYLNACGVQMRQAVATSSATGLPIALAGAVGFVLVGWGHSELPATSLGFIYLPAALVIMVVSALFAPLGAHLAHRLPLDVLKRVFAALLVAVGIKLLLG